MSAKSEDAVVQEWLMVLKVATDTDSPFCGMVDLREIFELPRATQWKIFDQLTAEQKERLQAVYGTEEKRTVHREGASAEDSVIARD
jgi:hypothetical protein